MSNKIIKKTIKEANFLEIFLYKKDVIYKSHESFNIFNPNEVNEVKNFFKNHDGNSVITLKLIDVINYVNSMAHILPIAKMKEFRSFCCSDYPILADSIDYLTKVLTKHYEDKGVLCMN